MTKLVAIKLTELDPPREMPPIGEISPQDVEHFAMDNYHGRFDGRKVHYDNYNNTQYRGISFRTQVDHMVSEYMRILINYNENMMNEEETERKKEKFAKMVKMQDAIDFLSDDNTQVLHRGEYYAVVRKFDMIMEIDQGEIYISDYANWVAECAQSIKQFKERTLADKVTELTKLILDGESLPKDFDTNLNSAVQAL